jgi:hypothetical protein
MPMFINNALRGLVDYTPALSPNVCAYLDVCEANVPLGRGVPAEADTRCCRLCHIGRENVSHGWRGLIKTKEEMKMDKTKEAYAEILELLNKYKDICIYDFDELQYKIKCHLLGIDLKEKFGFDIEPKDIKNHDWIRFDDWRVIGMFGGKHKRTISWSDDGTQPADELLLEIGFSTGAYIFGEDYPIDLFNKFFLELKAYQPKFSDTTNRNLYFAMDNAGKIFNDFHSILSKYYKINQEDCKRRKIEKLKKEIAEMEKQN